MAHDQDQAGRDAWAAHTQVATQLMEERVPAQALRELGRQVSPTLRELFVVCDPSEALRQHFEMGVTPFVLLHDVGHGAGRAFLQALSERTGWRVQSLSIRRQGFGTVLATLSYLDCPLPEGSVRLYLGEVQAEPGEQLALLRLLAGSARLQVLVGGVPMPADVAALVNHWREQLQAWHPDGVLAVLALPQVRDPAWMLSLSSLARTPRWQVEVSPVTQAVAANWTLLATHWNRLAQSGVPGAMPLIDRVSLPETPPTSDGAAAVAVARVPKPMPVVPGGAARLVALQAQTGALQACVFDLVSREVWAQTEGADGAAMATQGHALLVAVGRIGQGLTLGRSVREAHVSLGEAQVLLRPTRLRSGSVLMLILPRDADAARARERVLQYEAQALLARPTS